MKKFFVFLLAVLLACVVLLLGSEDLRNGALAIFTGSTDSQEDARPPQNFASGATTYTATVRILPTFQEL
jgi:hypothetical protein